MAEIDTTVAKGATSIYFSNVVLLGVNTVYFILIANVLSTKEVGILAGMQIIVFGFSTLANLSLPQMIQSNIMLPHAVAKFIPEFLARGEKGKASQSFFTFLTLTFTVSTLLSLTLYTFADPVSKILFRGEAATSWIHLLAVDTWLFTMGQLFYGGLVGLGRIPRASLLLIFAFTIRYILGAGLVIAGVGIPGLLAAFITGDLIFLLLSGVSCLKPMLTRREPVSTRFIFSYSAPLLVASLIIFGVTQMDRLFTFLQLELSDLGIYNIAVTASTIGAFAPNAITTALLPSLSTLEAKNMFEEFRKLARDYTRYVALIATPMSFGIAALAPALVQLFGPQYLPAATPVAVMSIATGLTAVSAVYNGELLATRRSRSVMLVNVAGLGVLLICLTILTPGLAFIGVAWSRAVMTGAIAVFLAYVARRRGLFALDQGAYRDSVIASSIMGAAVFLILSFIGGYRRQMLALVFLIPLGVAVYLVVLRVLKTFRQDDMEFIRRLSPKRAEQLVKIVSKIVGVT